MSIDWTIKRRDHKPHEGRRAPILVSSVISMLMLVLFYSVLTAADSVGSETRINTTVANDQSLPHIAMASDGRAVITWQSEQDGDSSYGIYGQRLGNDGSFQGSEFRVNSYTTGPQYHSSVAMNSSGVFVVAWVSNGQDGDGLGICAQRYDGAGSTQGSEFVVNNYTTGGQEEPCVAMNGSGEFVIAWSSNGEDGSGYGIFAKRYSSSGTGLAAFQVNSYSSGHQFHPSIAICGNGSFIIAWTSASQDGSGEGVYAQRYFSNGSKIGGEFAVNTYTDSDQDFPAVAMTATGIFVISWESNGQDGDGYGIFARKFHANGSAIGSEFKANNYTSGNQLGSSVAIAPNDHFVITWTSDGQDGGGYGVYAREFTLPGTNSSEFRVNSQTTDNQYQPVVAMDSLGNYMIAWQSNLQDGSEHGIYAQRYNNALLIPEFDEIAIPVVGMAGLFLAIGYLRKRNR